MPWVTSLSVDMSERTIRIYIYNAPWHAPSNWTLDLVSVPLYITQVSQNTAIRAIVLMLNSLRMVLVYIFTCLSLFLQRGQIKSCVNWKPCYLSLSSAIFAKEATSHLTLAICLYTFIWNAYFHLECMSSGSSPVLLLLCHHYHQSCHSEAE